MAKRKPIVIDGEIREIPSSAKTISDIETISPPNFALVPGKGLIPRDEFARTPIPDGYERIISDTVKAGGRAVKFFVVDKNGRGISSQRIKEYGGDEVRTERDGSAVLYLSGSNTTIYVNGRERYSGPVSRLKAQEVIYA